MGVANDVAVPAIVMAKKDVATWDVLAPNQYAPVRNAAVGHQLTAMGFVNSVGSDEAKKGEYDG